MYPIIQKFISKNRSHKTFKPSGCVLHETADAGATDEREYEYFNTHDIEASAHAFVDWDSITQTVPWNEVAWHANRPANALFIGIEMCRPKTHNVMQFNEVYKKTVWLFGYVYINILKITKITKDNLMSHDECRLKWKITTHTDPTALFKEYGKTMDGFRKDVQNEINKQLVQEVFELFKDEKDISMWAKDSVKKVSDLGLIKGNDLGEFKPKNGVTREEFAVVLDRLLKLLGK